MKNKTFFVGLIVLAGLVIAFISWGDFLIKEEPPVKDEAVLELDEDVEKELCYNETHTTELTTEINYSWHSHELEEPLVQVKEEVKDVEDLTGLDCLEVLILEDSIIFDISFVKEFENLKVLAIDPKMRQGFLLEEPVSDISPLEKLNKLEILDLSFSSPNSISYLADLKHLRKLNLGYTEISDDDIEHISGLKNLEEINLKGTYLTDITFLKELPNLEKLSLGVSYWPGISNLDADSFSDISPILELDNLKELRIINASQITDTSPLENLDLDLLIIE